jgi:hypothetical protein
MKWKGCGRKRSRPNLKCHPFLVPGETEEGGLIGGGVADLEKQKVALRDKNSEHPQKCNMKSSADENK